MLPPDSTRSDVNGNSNSFFSTRWANSFVNLTIALRRLAVGGRHVRPQVQLEIFVHLLESLRRIRRPRASQKSLHLRQSRKVKLPLRRVLPFIAGLLVYSHTE